MKKTKHFVFDANTLISAFLLSHQTTAARAYDKAKGSGTLVFSEETLDEFADVFVRPKFDKYLSLNRRMTIIGDFRSIVKLTTVKASVNICRDPKDNKYLEIALSASAACIVTGDKDLLVLNPFENIPILTAGDFLASF